MLSTYDLTNTNKWMNFKQKPSINYPPQQCFIFYFIYHSSQWPALDYNNIMRGHQKYTLATFLNSHQIQPQIYQQILNDIKSPLEQVSVDLTNDNSYQIQRIPKRPNIPPPPPKSPLNNLGQFNFSRTHQSQQLSIKASPDKAKQIFQDEVIESVLSPLDHQISFKQEGNQEVPLCGGLLQSILKEENGFQIQLPLRTKSYKRKPIFGESKLLKSSKQYKPIQQVIRILQQVGQLEMAYFFQLLSQLERELASIALEKEQIKDYLAVIYHQLSQNAQHVAQQQNQNINTHRIFRRLQSKNTYELVAKLIKQTSCQRSKQAEKKLNNLIQCFDNIETIIADFMQNKNAVEILNMIYNFLQENFSSEATLLHQIHRLCHNFSCIVDPTGFEFIWRESNIRCLTHDQFIEGITMNDCIVRVPRGYEEDLSKKGFERNK